MHPIFYSSVPNYTHMFVLNWDLSTIVLIQLQMSCFAVVLKPFKKTKFLFKMYVMCVL